MSATDELRRRLDERGVEYEANDDERVKETCWTYMGELTAAFTEYYNGTTRFDCDTWCFTPEQAMTATFGSDTCRYVPDYTTAAICVSNGVTGHCECEKCGKSIDPWDDYCRHCGARITEVRR